MKTSHFPLSLLPLSLLPLSFSCSFCRGAFSLATVKINCSASIYFTKEDLTTTENLTRRFMLYLPNFHGRRLFSEALICYFVELKYFRRYITHIIFAPHSHITASKLFQIWKCFVVATNAAMMHCVKSKAFDGSDKTGQLFPLLPKSGHFTDARKCM